MRQFILAAALLLGVASAASAGETLTPEQRMERLEQRMSEMEKHYTQELETRDQEIARLRAMVEKAAPTSPTTLPATGAAGSDLDRSRDNLLKELDPVIAGRAVDAVVKDAQERSAAMSKR